ncbi:MAG: RluA family pseudouridine synthase [Bacteroidales bacterium]|nr:RluA family pseudouridine synthase [Bacteroidales bacterium]
MNSRELKLVYEDKWLVVVEKPAGLLTMSTGRGQEKEITAYSILKEHFGELFIVHRLDRDTSGLVVFAKDHETKLSLQENWYEAVLERKYTAILEGHIDDEEGWIETWVYEHPKSMKVHCYALRRGDNPEKPPQKDWHYASTHCRRIKQGTIEGEPYTEVEFELETGRKNQIRVHSQWIGHPIAGDRKYGAQTNPIGRLALHSHTLTFIHPWTGKTLKFSSRLPRPFTRLK